MAKGKRKARLKHGTRATAKPRDCVSLSQPTWDQGASGPANRAGLVSEPVTWTNDKGERVNPNGVKRMRRVDMLEVYHGRGWISTAGYTAAERLRDAWEGIQRSPGVDMAADRVDKTAKPDATIEVQIDGMSRLIRISRLIAKGDERIIGAVVYDRIAIGALREYRGRRHEMGKAHLRDALDRLAVAMGG